MNICCYIIFFVFIFIHIFYALCHNIILFFPVGLCLLFFLPPADC